MWLRKELDEKRKRKEMEEAAGPAAQAESDPNQVRRLRYINDLCIT